MPVESASSISRTIISNCASPPQRDASSACTRPLWVVYADIANNSGVEDGSALFPYNTVQEAINAAGLGTNMIIRTGDYVEGPKIFEKRGVITAENGLVRVR
ncbi:MAG: hypothetical protein LC135_15915 [Phycisphaerae bacterium]|jgi:hypothetical protein|nr:hypothetical protein [Phycisphaerae bacterium]MCZ2401327.1 hypothetical protein [Phycisphaerae bacterium]NUQ50206.1 hypothetical protein [Phycisphaerae bacterium]